MPPKTVFEELFDVTNEIRRINGILASRGHAPDNVRKREEQLQALPVDAVFRIPGYGRFIEMYVQHLQQAQQDLMISDRTYAAETARKEREAAEIELANARRQAEQQEKEAARLRQQQTEQAKERARRDVQQASLMAAQNQQNILNRLQLSINARQNANYIAGRNQLVRRRNSVSDASMSSFDFYQDFLK